MPTNTTVEDTATLVDSTVNVLTLHPRGVARSSHLSFEPRGHIWSDNIGASIGTRPSLGTQEDDYLRISCATRLDLTCLTRYGREGKVETPFIPRMQGRNAVADRKEYFRETKSRIETGDKSR